MDPILGFVAVLAIGSFAIFLVASIGIVNAISKLADAIKGLPGWKEYKVPEKETVDMHADLSNHLPR
jgi:hypothetical protein